MLESIIAQVQLADLKANEDKVKAEKAAADALNAKRRMMSGRGEMGLSELLRKEYGEESLPLLLTAPNPKPENKEPTNVERRIEAFPPPPTSLKR